MRHGLGAVLAAGSLAAAISAAEPVGPRAPSRGGRIAAASPEIPDGRPAAGGIPAILLWKPADVLSSSPESILTVLTALDEDVHLTSTLFEFGPDLNVHEIVWVFAGIFPNNHLITGPEGIALDSFMFDGGRLVVEGGDCFNHDPDELDTYDLRPAFGLLDGPDGTRDLFHVSGMNVLSGFEFQYIGPNRFTDDLVPSTSLAVLRNTANSDIAAIFQPSYGSGRGLACTFETGRLIDVPSLQPGNTKIELLAECLRLMRDVTPPVLLTSTGVVAETLAAGDSTAVPFQISNPGLLNDDLVFTIAEFPAVPWLAPVPSSGTLEGDETTSIATVLFAQSLAPGEYSGTLIVNANDPANPTDTIAVSLLVLPPPDLLIDPDSLAFEVDVQGGTDVDSLTLHNAGGSALTYSLAIDDGGAHRTEFPSEAVVAHGGNRYRGNVYFATTTTPLKRIEHRADVPSPTTFEFFVYQGEDSVAVYTKIFSTTVPIEAGPGWKSSGPIDVPITAGDYYFIGAAWAGELTYYADGGSTPLPAVVPFGTCLGSAAGNVYPSPPTKLVDAGATLNSQALETGETGDVAILSPIAGTLEPDELATVHLRATGEQVTGTLPATLLITSNDSSRLIETTLEFPLTVLVTGPSEAPRERSAIVTVLHPASPNPFQSSTSVRFDLARDGFARLCILDVAGRQVRILTDGPVAAGTHALMWDGRDERGSRVAAGTYFVRLEGLGGVASDRIVLLR